MYTSKGSRNAKLANLHKRWPSSSTSHANKLAKRSEGATHIYLQGAALGHSQDFVKSSWQFRMLVGCYSYLPARNYDRNI